MTDELEQQYLGVEDVVHSEKVTFRGALLVVGALSLASAGFSVTGSAVAR